MARVLVLLVCLVEAITVANAVPVTESEEELNKKIVAVVTSFEQCVENYVAQRPQHDEETPQGWYRNWVNRFQAIDFCADEQQGSELYDRLFSG